MTSLIAYQMNDFQNSIEDFQKKFETIYFCAEEIANDYTNGLLFID